MNFETKLCIKVAFVLFPFFVAIIRLLQVLPGVPSKQDHKELALQPEHKGANIMILLGSGGHTGEMLRILGKVDLSEFSRTWVVSSNDSNSLNKAKVYEQNLKSKFKYEYVLLHRARDVGDSLFMSLKNTFKSFISTWKSLYNLPELPAVLVLNGPGTSVPLAYILFGLKYFGFCDTRIIYIESLARVNLLSLSGRLLMPIANRFIVQWERLFVEYKRAEYYGILL